MDQLYDFSVKCRNNSISQEELITKLNTLRGGAFVDVVGAIAFIAAMIIIASNTNAFQPAPGAIIPPHLQWLYGNQQPGNHFGYGKEVSRLQD